MNKDARRELAEATLIAEQEKALDLAVAMDKLYIDMWGEPPEEE